MRASSLRLSTSCTCVVEVPVLCLVLIFLSPSGSAYVKGSTIDRGRALRKDSKTNGSRRASVCSATFILLEGVPLICAKVDGHNRLLCFLGTGFSNNQTSCT